MSDAYARFVWLTYPNDSPPHGGDWRPIGDNDFAERESREPDRRPYLGSPPEWARDLQRVARAVFAVDKRAIREKTYDEWTRHLHLRVPVSAPDHWAAVRPLLTSLLSTTTGDAWELEFTRSGPGPAIPQRLPIAPARCPEVALFSGGLDSFSWAWQRTVAPSALPLHLVMFEEQRVTNEQNHLLECMGNRPRKPVLQDTQSQTVHRVRGCGSEYSTRSRGLLYLATAVHAAAAESANVVRVPENGQLALNPPLTASRTGSLSTRSVHPWTLHQLNRLIEEIAEGEQPVRVENPFAMMTKAEVCRAAASAGQQLQESTVSCGASPRRRLGSSNAAHCGACFPCLVRRSSLLHTFGDDRTEYLTDPWRNGIESGTEHWSALRRWLDREFTEVDLVTDTPLPPDADAAALTGVVEKGRNELRQFVEWAQAGEVRPGQG